MTDPARISELMLQNLFAVFNVRDPEQRAEAIARNYTEDVTCGIDVALVRDGQIAELHTLLTAEG
jgi:hypothetical protein